MTAVGAIGTAVMEAGWITRAERVSGGMQETLMGDEYNDENVPRETSQKTREIESPEIDSKNKNDDSWTGHQKHEKQQKTERQ